MDGQMNRWMNGCKHAQTDDNENYLLVVGAAGLHIAGWHNFIGSRQDNRRIVTHFIQFRIKDNFDARCLAIARCFDLIGRIRRELTKRRQGRAEETRREEKEEEIKQRRRREGKTNESSDTHEGCRGGKKSIENSEVGKFNEQ